MVLVLLANLHYKFCSCNSSSIQRTKILQRCLPRLSYLSDSSKLEQKRCEKQLEYTEVQRGFRPSYEHLSAYNACQLAIGSLELLFEMY